jgi:hypothetical protein
MRQALLRQAGMVMTKKQFVFTSFTAAIPAYLLVAAMISSLFQNGMLTDDASVSTTMWVIFTVTGIGVILIGFLPFAVMLFPGLYPTSGAADHRATAAPAPGKLTSDPDEEEDDGGFADDDSFGDDASDENEDAGDIEDDFDDFDLDEDE